MASRNLNVKIIGDSSSLIREFARSSRATNQFSGDLSRAGRGIIAITAGYRGLARSVAFAGGAFVGAASVTAGLKASIEGFSEFQDSLQQTVGLAGVAQDRIAGFSKQILELAPIVGKSPAELAKAFYFVASSGIAVSDAMNVVTQAAKDSAAGLGETQTVADAITSAMNAYGAANLSAAQASDVLVATVREGKGEATDFASVIGNVAALAAQLGVSFDQVGAALAAQTRLGTDAETSATQLQRVFSTLVKVTPQSAKAFASVGLNADELRATLGERGGLLKVLQQVQKAFGNNLPALAKAFGDVRAVRGVLALVGNQAGATADIFDRLSKSAGASASAFDAVSKDTAQRFRQLRASAEVAGISIGALFAPLAGQVAKALASAATQFSQFVDRITAQRTLVGRLNVVWEGVQDAARGAESALSSAIAGVDWAKVWAGARGIADGLQARLEEIDWGRIGAAIGDGLARAVQVAIPAAKEIAQRLTDAVSAVDVVALGKKLGPGLAAALATAFKTLLDPAFWLKNWDLAISVALAVFPVGRFARLGGLLLRPFARIGADAVLALTGAVERFAPRIASALLTSLLRLPGLVGRALEPLTNVVGRAFARLGTIARFTVKVLGIDFAIHAIEELVKGIASTLTGGLEEAWNRLKRQAIRAVLAIIEPFTHLPGFLGGGPFREMKNALQSQLDGMVAASKDAARQIKTAFLDTPGGGDFARTAAGGSGSINRTAGFGGDGTDTAPRTTTPRVPPRVTSTASTAATQTVSKEFTLPFRLQLAKARAEATKTATDDLKVARDIRAFIVRAIPRLSGKKLLGAYQELSSATNTLADAASAAAQKARDTVQARQFRALGLDVTGQPLTPTARALRREFERVNSEIGGTSLDTNKMRNSLKRVKAVLTGTFGAATKEVRAQIKSMLDDIDQQFKDRGGPQTGFVKANPTKLLAGLGLTPEAMREARLRLSQISAGGRVPTPRVGALGVAVAGGGINFNGPVTQNFNGIQNMRQIRNALDREAAKRPAVRRGR